MYFLAKNIRTCSKTFRGAPDNVQLYKDGVLNWKYLAKNLSYFISHPEQIKQKLKEQDAHMLCQFFDSDEYKRRVTQFLEMQGRFLAKDTIKGKKGPGVKYQHVLSCAQPAHKKLFLNVIEASQLNSPDNLKKKRIKKCTIIEEIMKKKSSIDVRQDSTLSCFKAEVLKPKKSKHKSTIMPIFLKKIKMRREGSADLELEVVPKDIDIHYETARRIKSEAEEDSEPLYAQILLRKNVEQSSRALAQKQSERGKLNRIEPNVPRVASKKQLHTELSHQAVKDVLIFEHSGNKKVFYNPPRYFASATQIKEIHNKTTVNKPKNVVPRKLGSLSNVVPLRMASSAAKMPLRPPTVQLCPKKNMNLKSYSDFLCVQPPKKKTGKIDKKYDEDGKSVKIHVLKPEKKMKKGPSMLIEEVLKSKSLKSFKLDNNFEKRSTMMKVMENHKRKVRKSKKKNELIFMSLFQKVKLGTSQNATIGIAKTAEPAPQNVVEPTVLKPKKPEPIIKEPPKPTNEQQSFTYKIVAKNRERRDAKLKEKFQMNPPYWQNKFRFSFGKSPEEVPGNSDVLSIKNHGQTLEVVSKNISRSLHRPVPHFVDHANKAKPVAEFSQYRGYHAYLKKV